MYFFGHDFIMFIISIFERFRNVERDEIIIRKTNVMEIHGKIINDDNGDTK